jgi:hypothetical protein
MLFNCSVALAVPLKFDGKEFDTQESLDEYKASLKEKHKAEFRDGKVEPDGTRKSLIDDKWEVAITPSALGDRETAFISLYPEFNHAGLMALRCKDNETDLMFDVSAYMGREGSTMEYKIGDAPISKEKIIPSSGLGRGFFARNPIPFLKKLSGENRLAIRVKPYDGTSVERTFDISGIEKIIDIIKETCKWKEEKSVKKANTK